MVNVPMRQLACCIPEIADGAGRDLFSLLTPAPLTYSLIDGNEAQKAKKCEKVLPKKCAKHYGAGRDLFSLFTHAPLTYSLPDGKKGKKVCCPKRVQNSKLWFPLLWIYVREKQGVVGFYLFLLLLISLAVAEMKERLLYQKRWHLCHTLCFYCADWSSPYCLFVVSPSVRHFTIVCYALL